MPQLFVAVAWFAGCCGTVVGLLAVLVNCCAVGGVQGFDVPVVPPSQFAAGVMAWYWLPGGIPGCWAAGSAPGRCATGNVPRWVVAAAVFAARLVLFVVSAGLLFCWFVFAWLFFVSYALAICQRPTNWLVAQCVRTGSNGRASIWMAS